MRSWDPSRKYKQLRRKGSREKPPNTTLKHILKTLLPGFCITFLWSEPHEFWPAKFFLGAGIGILFALALTQILIFPMTIMERTKVELLCGMTGLAALGWGISPHFRCASLLVIPKFGGKEGRIYILTYLLAAVFDGPVANIRHNLGEVVGSISCTVELQIENAKRAWKVSLAPMRKILSDMVKNGRKLRTESQDVARAFAELNKQVASKAGYDDRGRLARRGAPGGTSSTQELYEAKTRMRCKQIIRQAVKRCQSWFSAKHRACMKAIAVPLVNHLLCLPMKFSFLCHLANVMHAWCQDTIPVEGNFGQTYDRINGSVDNLNQDFSASIVVQEEQQEMLVGANLSSHRHLVDDVNDQLVSGSRRLGTAVAMMRVMLSCTFILVFASASSYTTKYNENIRFDNLYISRYFRQIDARRRKQKKRTLLPLRRAEEGRVIDPLRLSFQPAETRSLMLELLGCLPPLAFLSIACALDSLLYIIFSTIRNHSFVQYAFRSSHHLEVRVGGQTMMARLLRSTIGALNTSSEMVVETNNLQCLPEPRGMSRAQYISCALPIGALVILCFLQAYVFRIRRVIAAFYFPKREKKRIIFLYNEMLRQRMAFVIVQRKRIILRARRRERVKKPLLDQLGQWCPFLKRFVIRRCILCDRPETRNSHTCPKPACGTVYCRLCWRDMGKVCFACSPGEVLSEDESSSGEIGYAD